MITPEQFRLRWRSEVAAKNPNPEDVRLLTTPAQQLASVRLPESCRQFLAEAGLPKGCAPSLGFEEVGKGLPRIWERYSPGQWQPEEKVGLDHYLLIGYDDDAGNPISVDERDGRVVELEHELLFSPKEAHARIMFMNSGIPELAESLLVFQTTPPGERLAALARVDPPAVTKGAFWFREAAADRIRKKTPCPRIGTAAKNQEGWPEKKSTSETRDGDDKLKEIHTCAAA
jgi:hypothetical protein